MLKFLVNLVQATLFYLSVQVTKFKRGNWKPFAKQHHKVKVTKMALKAGDSYRLGECIVTLAKFGIEGKQEVAAKITAFNKRRELRHKELTEQAEKIMLMSPEELKRYQVEEWLKQRRSFNEQKFYENLKDTYQQESVK